MNTVDHSKSKLVILDDFFPEPTTGFRIAEFTYLLESGTAKQVFTTANNIETSIGQLAQLHPNISEQVLQYNVNKLQGDEIVYMNFLNNAYYFLPELERLNIPFVFTLYPGGGLSFTEEQSVLKLDKVLKSPQLKFVITTQPMITRYLYEKFPHVLVQEIYGVPINPIYLVPGAGMRTNYPSNSGDLVKVCFVAHKYSDGGVDKGLDTFIDIVKILKKEGISVEVTLVGPWTNDDFDQDSNLTNINFLGLLPAESLRDFFLGQHILISPNKPNQLSKGSFDGFPLTTSVEAMLSGVLLVASDELDQNRIFEDGRDCVIDSPSAEIMAERILRILGVDNLFSAIAQSGLRIVRQNYSVENQLDKRVKLLSGLV